MPDVIVKLASGRSDQQRAVMAHANVPDLAVSVSIKDLKPKDWVDKVYVAQCASTRSTERSIATARDQPSRPLRHCQGHAVQHQRLTARAPGDTPALEQSRWRTKCRSANLARAALKFQPSASVAWG